MKLIQNSHAEGVHKTYKLAANLFPRRGVERCFELIIPSQSRRRIMVTET